MADLVTRLLLDSSGFNNNIVKSSRQVQEFQQITGNIVGTIYRKVCCWYWNCDYCQ